MSIDVEVKPKSIKYKGEKYKRVKESQIGDIALCSGISEYTTKGKYYLMVECYAPNGWKGIITDDGERMGIHDTLRHFKYFRKKKKVKNMQELETHEKLFVADEYIERQNEYITQLENENRELRDQVSYIIDKYTSVQFE